MLLPKSTPMFDGVSTTRIPLSGMLEKLNVEKITGYLIAEFKNVTVTGFLLNGQVREVIFEELFVPGKTGAEALAEALKLETKNEAGSVSVYATEPHVIEKLMHYPSGKIRQARAEISKIDVRELMGALRSENFEGLLTFSSTDDNVAIAIFEKGAPSGYITAFSSGRIEKDSTESQKIAKLSGAKVEVIECDFFATKPDLRSSLRVEKSKVTTAVETVDIKNLHTKLRAAAAIVDGDVGQTMLDRELSNKGGLDKVQRDNLRDVVLVGFETRANSIAKESVVKKAMEALRAAWK